MKIWAFLAIIPIGLLSLSMMMFSGDSSPENAILGKWKEVKWEYEKVDDHDKLSTNKKEVSDHVKQLLGQDLIIHQSEMWEFLPDGSVFMYDPKGATKNANWKLKGRGHILKLESGKNITEDYNVSVENNIMTLQFGVDMQIRGIVKLTFERV